jgi:uncharacterized repeat protein (TIGR03803 family)
LRLAALAGVVAVTSLAAMLITAPAIAQSYEVLHTFSADTGHPSALLLTSDGSLYGTAATAGGFGLGSVFVLRPNGSAYDFVTLWEFSGGQDGEYPVDGLVLGTDGYFYGTTRGAIGGLQGTVFRIDASGNLTTLHTFTGSDGQYPQGTLVWGGDGFLYGTTPNGGPSGWLGGSGSGTVFRIDTSGDLTTLYSFSDIGRDGQAPLGLVRGADGKFYGATSSGGCCGYGTVFRIDASGSLTTLYSFDGSDGRYPGGGLVQGSDGAFYGTTYWGGGGSWPTVFRITISGAVSTLYRFVGNEHPFNLIAGTDGYLYGLTYGNPNSLYGGRLYRIDLSGVVTTIHDFTPDVEHSSSVIQDSGGALYGTTSPDGGAGWGTVYRIDPSGSFTTLYSFTGNDGFAPYAGLVQGGDGFFYGTTAYGGPYGRGTVFGMSTAGSLTMLNGFAADNCEGNTPSAPLVQGNDGNFYGTTYEGGCGGTYPQGTVFSIDTFGSLKTLHTFDADTEGGHPSAALIQGRDGNFYGTGYSDDDSGIGNGTVFGINTSGSLTMLYRFSWYDGGYPLASLLDGGDGKFYGTTSRGGENGAGTVFSIDSAGNLTTLHNFDGTDGADPEGGLAKGNDGFFYGTTSSDGPDWGTVFRIDRSGGFQTLYRFNGGNDGANPQGNLVLAGDGNFYGVAAGVGPQWGVPAYRGTIYRMTSSGELTTLHTFNGEDGMYPNGGLLLASDGRFYGTTTAGGPYDAGVVFRLTVPLTCFPAVQISGPDVICAGQSVTLDAGPGYSTYLWSTGDTTRTIAVTPSATTAYSVSVTGQYACTGTATKTVTLNPLPTPVITQSPGSGGSVVLTASASSSYLWSTGATSQAITVSTSGPYQVTVTNAAGCASASAVTNVSVTPTGSSVSVTDGSVTATFATVSAAGETTAIPIDPSTAGSLPAGGYALSALGIAYNISTTAAISGNIIIGFVVPASVDEVTFNSLRILHGEGGVLVDRTYYSSDGCSASPTAPCPAPNFATRTIYAQVSSLSPFVLATLGTPVIEYITVPSAPVAVSTAVGVQARFTDPGTHTASWAWGDNSTSAGTMTESNGIGNVAGSHSYAAAGVYQTTLSVTDTGGLVGQRTSPYIVIYDPNGGYVTGGGTFSSPAGAYVAHPSSTGSANFGFVAKYPHNGGSPTGDTEFHFSDLNFHSSGYDWLVVTVPKAQYQGSGTINGTGNYGFIVTVIDGQASGGGGVDKIRMKIWDKNNGNAIVYDNQMGAPDTANPNTAISGGSIVLHN